MAKLSSKQKEFLGSIIPAANLNQEVHNIPAIVTVLQAILESGWGDSALAKQAHNLFGIKANKGWKGATLELPGFEIVNGKRVNAKMLWRKYRTKGDSITDHAKFLVNNKRYKAAFNHTVDDWVTFLAEIHVAGYATDPEYVTKLVKLEKSYNLLDYINYVI